MVKNMVYETKICMIGSSDPQKYAFCKGPNCAQWSKSLNMCSIAAIGEIASLLKEQIKVTKKLLEELGWDDSSE